MKSRHFTLALLAASVAVAFAATPALAQTSGSTSTSTSTTTTSTTSTTSTTAAGHETARLDKEFTTLAGSQANAQALVTGLHDGSAVTLTTTVPGTNGAAATTTTTTFTPDTGKMSYGNVKIALSLAEASLVKAGITNPTAADLQAALNGGSVTTASGSTVDFKGVLAARASGEGWGQIAKSMGFKLGEVLRSPKRAGEMAAHAHSKAAHVAHTHVQNPQANGSKVANTNKPDHVSKPEQVSKPDVPQRPDRPDHPDHVGRPGG